MSPAPRNIQEIQKDMEKSQAERTTDKQKGLAERYENDVTKFVAEFNARHEKYEAEFATRHMSQKRRLRDLIVRKAELETEIIQELAELRVRYGNMKTEMECVVEWMGDDLKSGLRRLEDCSAGREHGTGNDGDDEDGKGKKSGDVGRRKKDDSTVNMKGFSVGGGEDNGKSVDCSGVRRGENCG